MNIFDFLNLLWGALRGRTGGPDFIVVYTALGAILWAFLLFKVFLTEGLQVATGQRTELPRILVKYVFVAGMFFVWPMASDSIFTAIGALANMFYPDLTTLLERMYNSAALMQEGQAAEQASQGIISTILGTVQNVTAGFLFTGIGVLVLFLCYMLILISIAGSLTILAMNLVLGPVFFALAFDKDFRSIAMHWFSAVLSYSLLIPLYGGAITIAAAIAGAAIPTNLFGLSSTGQVAAQLLGPFMAVGVIFSTNKVVNALVGGAAGAGLGSSVMGVAGIGLSLVPGGSMLRSTAMASGAAATAGGGAVRTIGSAASSKLSSTAKSAIGGEP